VFYFPRNQRRKFAKHLQKWLFKTVRPCLSQIQQQSDCDILGSNPKPARVNATTHQWHKKDTSQMIKRVNALTQ